VKRTTALSCEPGVKTTDVLPKDSVPVSMDTPVNASVLVERRATRSAYAADPDRVALARRISTWTPVVEVLKKNDSDPLCPVPIVTKDEENPPDLINSAWKSVLRAAPLEASAERKTLSGAAAGVRFPQASVR